MLVWQIRNITTIPQKPGRLDELDLLMFLQKAASLIVWDNVHVVLKLKIDYPNMHAILEFHYNSKTKSNTTL